jgi:hypothetical protein
MHATIPALFERHVQNYPVIIISCLMAFRAPSCPFYFGGARVNDKHTIGIQHLVDLKLDFIIFFQ